MGCKSMCPLGAEMTRRNFIDFFFFAVIIFFICVIGRGKRIEERKNTYNRPKIIMLVYIPIIMRSNIKQPLKLMQNEIKCGFMC